jgi:hypothetical protein
LKLTFSVHPKRPKVNLSTNLHGPAYIGEKLPILITLENGEDEAVSLEIQFEGLSVVGEKGTASQVFIDIKKLKYLNGKATCVMTTS